MRNFVQVATEYTLGENNLTEAKSKVSVGKYSSLRKFGDLIDNEQQEDKEKVHRVMYQCSRKD